MNSFKVEPIEEKGGERQNPKLTKFYKNGANDYLWEPVFITYLSASVGSGKSTLLMNLVKQYKKHFGFDQTYWFSPHNLDQKTRSLDKKIVRKTYDDVDEIIDKIKTEISMSSANTEDDNGPKRRPNDPVQRFFVPPRSRREHRPKPKDTLLVFDDATSFKSVLDKRAGFAKFLMSTRHYRTSILIAGHGLKRVPLAFRTVLSGLVIWRTDNKAEMKNIIEEYGNDMDKEDFMEIYESATKKKYGFLKMDFKKGKDEGRYSIGLNRPLYI